MTPPKRLGRIAPRTPKAVVSGLHTDFGELRTREVRRIYLPRTPVNKECKGPQRFWIDNQGEAVAVAVAVAVVAGTVFSGAGTVFSGAGTGSSTTTVRAGGTDGAAPSVPPALMRPRRNPTSSPKSSPIANVANHITTALSSLTVIPPGLAPLLLLPHRAIPSPVPYSHLPISL